MKTLKVASPEMQQLLRDTVNPNPQIACAAYAEMVKALVTPLKQGVLKGDIIGGIYQPVKFGYGQAVEWPLDFLAPGTEKNFVAYTIPSQGRIPERQVTGDYLMVPTFDVANSIDWPLKYSRDARWDVVERAMQVLEAGFIRKNNNDGWHTILAAGVGRNVVVYDDQATAGLYTKRLISLGKTTMRRKAGGNSTSINRGKLTDLYQSPEALEDIRSWDLTQVDDFTRREIFLSDDEFMALNKVFGVRLHDIDEFGVGQEYQNYYSNTLGGTLPGSKLEVAVGLDLSKDDSFVHPIRQEIEVFEDPNFHRQRRAGVYGFGEHGWAVLDSRRVLLLAL